MYASTGYTQAQSNDTTLAEKPVEQIIEYYFGNNAPQMTSIFMAESGLNPTAMNWNCHYLRSDGTPYSDSCKTIGERKNAWSVDCGIAQINFIGLVCPKEMFVPITNIIKAKEKLDQEGLKAWVSYKKSLASISAK